MSITVDNHIIRINGSNFVSHECEIHRTPVLFAALHRAKQLVKNPTVDIFFADGEPISAMNFQYVLDQIKRDFALTLDRLIVTTHDRDFSYPDATIKHLASPWFQSAIECLSPWPNLSCDLDAKLFGATFGRFSIDRFILAAHLGISLLDKSFLIFNPGPDWVRSQLQGVETHFAEELTWFETWTNPHRDLDPNSAGSVCHYGEKNLTPYHTIWPRYQIEIVAETNTHSPYFVTEKITRCLYTKKPFLLYGAAGALEFLRKLGFLTFNGIFNEDYDREQDPFARLDAVKSEITRLANLDVKQIHRALEQLEPILVHNQDNYNKIARRYLVDYLD